MTQLEHELTSWLIYHKDGLQEEFIKNHNKAYHLFPGSFQDIYVDNYAKNVLSIIKRQILQTFNINPEELNSFITQNNVSSIIGKDIFYPK